MSVPGFMPVFIGSSKMDTFRALTAVGATPHFALDAGSAHSASPASEYWTDLSPNGVDFFRGRVEESIPASAPDFNGTPGGMSENEYWTFNSGVVATSRKRFTFPDHNDDYMTYLHLKGAAFTMGAWINRTTTESGVMGNVAADGNFGVVLFVNGNGRLEYKLRAGTTSHRSKIGPIVPTGEWNFVCASIGEDGSTDISFMGLNGVYETMSVASGRTLFINPTAHFRIGSAGNARYMTENDKLAQAFLTEGQMTQEQLTDFFQLTRGRYGV